ncbi:MAG: potassium channel family protein [Acidobacteriota bacterium]|nr:potassium channel family protein [Acidobacteriota bacterium]
MAHILTALGVALLLLVAFDVYATILDARAKAGPITGPLYRGIWWATRWAAFRLSRPNRHRLLNFIGPLLMPALIILYLVILIGGFALIYYPRMPAQFNMPGGIATPTWFESIYFSGVSLTTLGFGDIMPRTIAMRLVSLAESASGFALISLAVTYLITVYGALERRRLVALSLYHQAGQGANVAGFLTHYTIDGKFYGLEAEIRTATRDLQVLYAAHVEHPIIHYFHPLQVYKGLPRILFLTLETCTVIRACLDDEQYVEIRQHPDVQTLFANARYILAETIAGLDLAPQARRREEPPFIEARHWERRYRQTLNQLAAAGVSTRKDVEAGWEEYRAQREEWESMLYRFAVHLGYDWDETTGDHDLRDANEEAKSCEASDEKQSEKSDTSPRSRGVIQ